MEIKEKQHGFFKITEHKEKSTIVKDMDNNQTYGCFPIENYQIGGNVELYIKEILDNRKPKFEYSILNYCYKIGSEYEFDIKERREKGLVLYDGLKSHFCPSAWAIKDNQKTIKLIIREINTDENKLYFEQPASGYENNETTIEDYINTFQKNIERFKLSNDGFIFELIDQTALNKYNNLIILNKKYEILNFFNITSDESISKVLQLENDEKELSKLVIAYNLLASVDLGADLLQKIKELIVYNLEKLDLSTLLPQQQFEDKEYNLEEKVIAYLYFYEDGNYFISKEPQASKFKDEIIIHENERQGFLLFCYENGCINKVKIRTILDKKFNKKFQNGFYEGSNYKKIFVTKGNGLVIIETQKDGDNYVKVHPTDNITTHEALNSMGINIVQKSFDELIDCHFIGLEHAGFLTRIINISRQNLGKKADNPSYKVEVEYLNKILF